MTSTAESHPGPGGFLQPTLPSPPASTATSASPAPSVLPRPRANPLKPGSSKESSFIDYVDNKLLGISRRYEKRYNADFEDEATSGIEGRGYERFGEMAKDLEAVIDVVWVSGTRMKPQIPNFGTTTEKWLCRYSIITDALPTHHRSFYQLLSPIIPIPTSSNFSIVAQT